MQPSKELIDHIIEIIKAKVLTAKTKAKTAVEPPQLIQNINNVTDVRLLDAAPTYPSTETSGISYATLIGRNTAIPTRSMNS